MLAEILSRYWWMTLIRGSIWILFGLVVFARPAVSLVALALTFGVFAIADGIGAVVTAVGGRKESESWWVLLIGGLASIGVGVLALTSPGITALALLFWIAVWAIAIGALQFAAAIRLRKEINGEFWLALSGLLSIAFGAFLIIRPGAGILSVLWLIASYAIAFGVILILLAFRVRGVVRRVAAAIKG